LYRGFESLSLRHPVWVAEKIGCIPLKILEIAAIPQLLPSNRTGESVPMSAAARLSGLFL
jgi:hypothetical protein